MNQGLFGPINPQFIQPNVVQNPNQNQLSHGRSSVQQQPDQQTFKMNPLNPLIIPQNMQYYCTYPPFPNSPPIIQHSLPTAPTNNHQKSFNDNGQIENIYPYPSPLQPYVPGIFFI